MTRILKPVPTKTAEYLSQVCAQYFKEACGWRVVEFDLGNAFTGRIDLLAADGSGIYLVTIGTADFPHDLFRSLTGYCWFRENQDFLRRIYSIDEIDLDLPVSLVVLSQDIPPGAESLCRAVCTVSVSLYRYRLFGSADDPDISVESIAGPGDGSSPREEDLEELRRKLGIELAGVTDQEIRDFRLAMGL